MTIWQPVIEDRSGPKYLAIADALNEDIRGGRIGEGDRLPTHRDLAYRLGVTVGTVSRAYGVAEQRGLTYGEVGRGTFVQGAAGSPNKGSDFFTASNDDGIVDFGLNMPAAGDRAEYFAKTLADISRSPNLEALLGYDTNGGLPAHKAAAASWLKRFNIDAPVDRIIICNGAQHALTVTLMAALKPGDTLAVEELTYPATKGLASRLGIKLEPVLMDSDGLIPDDFERLCRTRPPQMLYCLANLQNPTTAVLPEDRRRRIADIAIRYGVKILDDDVYGYILDDMPPPVAAFAPELSYFITGASKCMAPGLRIGFMVAPANEIEAARNALSVTSWMAAPLMSEIARRWIEDGTADELAAWHSQEALSRQLIADQAFGGLKTQNNPSGYHIWLHLPEPWRAADFVAKARDRGVVVIGSDAFAVGHASPVQAVRVCLGAPGSRDKVERGVKILAALAHERPETERAVF